MTREGGNPRTNQGEGFSRQRRGQQGGQGTEEKTRGGCGVGESGERVLKRQVLLGAFLGFGQEGGTMRGSILGGREM